MIWVNRNGAPWTLGPKELFTPLRPEHLRRYLRENPPPVAFGVSRGHLAHLDRPDWRALRDDLTRLGVLLLTDGGVAMWEAAIYPTWESVPPYLKEHIPDPEALALPQGHANTSQQQPKPVCACGHTHGLHFRRKYTPDGLVEDGCSRCTCQRCRCPEHRRGREPMPSQAHQEGQNRGCDSPGRPPGHPRPVTAPPRPSQGHPGALDALEEKVLALAARGWSSRRIAQALQQEGTSLSYRTVARLVRRAQGALL